MHGQACTNKGFTALRRVSFEPASTVGFSSEKSFSGQSSPPCLNSAPFGVLQSNSSAIEGSTEHLIEVPLGEINSSSPISRDSVCGVGRGRLGQLRGGARRGRGGRGLRTQ
ncbi:hypothetical protein Salat_1422600 [Sesamum alatum]|uniref:Uncharacterized protein n=1 Tax=Sesamum alatum TaxID=300844 RepID=A0AAE1YAI8_9LAMI|nr:hypothetical protein Salat_1422600 [Sesamum alatum]